MKFLLLIISLLLGGGDVILYHATSVSIPSDAVELAGLVYYPPGEGPFPAVVMIHGSEYGVKKNFKEYGKFFARNGIVTLVYDKRGCGDSGGDYLTAGFYDLSRDVLAAVAQLKHDPRVDSTRIGLWGTSQGGWIELLADSLSDDVAFLINVSGPAMTPAQHSAFALRKEMADAGYSETTIRDFLALQEKLIRYFHERKDWENIVREISLLLLSQEARAAYEEGFLHHWIDLAGRGETLPALEKIKLNPWIRDYDFDPLLFYQNLSTPILVIYGANDEVIDVNTSIQKLLPALRPPSRLLVYPGANHRLKIKRSPGIFFSPEFPEGYLETMADFIKKES